jgi:hypothetical protein
MVVFPLAGRPVNQTTKPFSRHLIRCLADTLIKY